MSNPVTAESQLPPHFREALDESTDDLLHDRVEDGATLLQEMRERIARYKADRLVRDAAKA